MTQPHSGHQAVTGHLPPRAASRTLNYEYLGLPSCSGPVATDEVVRFPERVTGPFRSGDSCAAPRRATLVVPGIAAVPSLVVGARATGVPR